MLLKTFQEFFWCEIEEGAGIVFIKLVKDFVLEGFQASCLEVVVVNAQYFLLFAMFLSSDGGTRLVHI